MQRICWWEPTRCRRRRPVPAAGSRSGCSPPDGDIAEDAACDGDRFLRRKRAPQPAGGWVMQMVAFRAAGSASGSSGVTLAWNATSPTGIVASDPVGYRLHMGLASGVYTQITTLGNVTTFTVSKLVSGSVFYFVVTAYNSAGVDGPPSSQVSYKAP